MKNLIITGIGSRETPLDILQEMIIFGQWAMTFNHIIRSGHAPGADWAFEQGSQNRCIVYLPWENFSLNLESNSTKIVVPYEDKYSQFTDKYHPAPGRLSNAARKLMNRNACQILGINLTNKSNVVICYTKDGKASGGTGQAIRIAQAYNIPVFNMYYQEYNTCGKLIKIIEELEL